MEKDDRHVNYSTLRGMSYYHVYRMIEFCFTKVPVVEAVV